MKEKIMELISLAYDIQSRGKGVDGYPYINVEISNYGTNVKIEIIEQGFDVVADPDGYYMFSYKETRKQIYKDCKQHLEKLLHTINKKKKVD